jgi:hypothetical protein
VHPPLAGGAAAARQPAAAGLDTQVAQVLVERVSKCIEGVADVVVAGPAGQLGPRGRRVHVTRGGVVGVVFEPAAVQVDQLLLLAAAIQDHAQPLVRHVVIGLEADRGFQAVHGFLEPAQMPQASAAIEPGLPQVGGQVSGALIGVGAGFLLVNGHQHVAEVHPGVRVAGHALQRLLQQRDALGPVALLELEHAEEVQRIGITGPATQDPLVHHPGLGHPASLVGGHRLQQHGIGRTHSRRLSSGPSGRASEFNDDWLMAVYNPAKNSKNDATQEQGAICRDESDSR